MMRRSVAMKSSMLKARERFWKPVSIGAVGQTSIVALTTW